METKTIRFEKGNIVPFWKIEALAYAFYVNVSPLFKERKDKRMNNINYYECLKSFTVQINIIEDENSSNNG